MKSIPGFVICSLILFFFAVVPDLIALNTNILNYGKDNGLVFRIFFTCVLSAFYFLAIFKRRHLKYFVVGLLIGLSSYILTFICSLASSLIINGNKSGWYLPELYFQLCATVFVVVITLIAKNNSRRSVIS